MRLKKERDTGDFLKKYQTDHSNRRRHRVLPRTQRRRIRARSRDPAPAAPGQPRPVPQRRRQAPTPVQQAQEARDHLRIRRRQGERLKNSQAQSTGPEERHLNPKYPTGSPPARAGAYTRRTIWTFTEFGPILPHVTTRRADVRTRRARRFIRFLLKRPVTAPSTDTCADRSFPPLTRIR